MKNTGSLADEIKEERKRLLKDKSTGYKIKYYVYYYKWYVLVTVAALILLGSVIHSVRTGKDCALGVALVNAALEGDYEATEDELEAIIGVDDKHEVQIDSEFYIQYEGGNSYNVQSEEKLYMTLATGQIDVLIAPQSVFRNLADVGYVCDLSLFLSEDELAKYDDIFIGHVADDSVEAVDDPNTPRHDVRCGIEISQLPLIAEKGWYSDSTQPVYLGFVAEGGNTENAKAFFEYLKG